MEILRYHRTLLYANEYSIFLGSFYVTVTSKYSHLLSRYFPTILGADRSTRSQLLINLRFLIQAAYTPSSFYFFLKRCYIITKAMKRSSWIRLESNYQASLMVIFLYDYAIFLHQGLDRPTKMSPQAYQPGPVLKNFMHWFALAVFFRRFTWFWICFIDIGGKYM